jgi:hypothetical protein
MLAVVWGNVEAFGFSSAILKGTRGDNCCTGGAREGPCVPLSDEVDAKFAFAPLTRCNGVSSLLAKTKNHRRMHVGTTMVFPQD